jgi:hypothetical protein
VPWPIMAAAKPSPKPPGRDCAWPLIRMCAKPSAAERCAHLRVPFLHAVAAPARRRGMLPAWRAWSAGVLDGPSTGRAADAMIRAGWDGSVELVW